ncbi:hypothetical protein HQ544_02520 [Candidatus Falkowbacteria bacterium]|nr:hypothetical protein [Candidatus Falkowbacteria bacterium]
MSEIIKLEIKSHERIYQELTQKLSPHREKPVGSVLFIVEGTKHKPIIGIRYPGKKVKERGGERVRIKWANLYDFEVIPFKNGKELNTTNFTFTELLRDFQENKKDSEEFWNLIKQIYYKNEMREKSPKLGGIDPKLIF